MFGKMTNDLSGHAQNLAAQEKRDAKAAAEEFAISERRFKEIIGAISDLSGAIKDLAVATASQRPPVVLNLVASNDEDLKKFATIFAQGIK